MWLWEGSQFAMRSLRQGFGSCLQPILITVEAHKGNRNGN